MRYELQKYETSIFHYIIGACTVAILVTIGMYIYLGTFSRYLGDDYCEAMLIKDASPLKAVIERYTIGTWPRATMRYSNLFFEGYSELLGKDGMQITITSFAFLWVLGLIGCVHEIRIFLDLDGSIQVDIFLGALVAFFSFLQAPNLFQTVYWRSAMMTHFAPLVFGSFLGAFLVKQIRCAECQSHSMLINLFAFFAAFIFAGFSEPPTTTALTALPLIIIFVWVWGKSAFKQKQLNLLFCTFAGIFVGLVVMLLSPATANASQDKTLNIIGVLRDSFLYSYLFMVDSLRTLPVPFAISALISIILVWFYRLAEPFKLHTKHKYQIMLALIAVLFLTWLLIAAGFSPSVYGQGFPEERARFLARTEMIVAVMLIGSFIGLLLKELYFRYRTLYVYWMVLSAFSAFSILYPLRSAYHIYKYDLPEFRVRAELWDLRNAYIVRHSNMGEKNIIVPAFSGVYKIKELDSSTKNWVNHCAAQYYDLESIQAVTMHGTNIFEYLDE
ncbi:MAG: hypothetical protein K8S20_06645 [Chloroflexi bacterium]|nr:hypothetical protein [Chloroflexota bacterium]